MAYGYVIVRLDVHDPEAFERYRARVPETLEAFGGEYLVRGGRQEVLEGVSPEPRTVVLRFPNYDAATAWHASEIYREPKAMREAAADAKMIVVKGLDQ